MPNISQPHTHGPEALEVHNTFESLAEQRRSIVGIAALKLTEALKAASDGKPLSPEYFTSYAARVYGLERPDISNLLPAYDQADALQAVVGEVKVVEVPEPMPASEDNLNNTTSTLAPVYDLAQRRNRQDLSQAA